MTDQFASIIYRGAGEPLANLRYADATHRTLGTVKIASVPAGLDVLIDGHRYEVSASRMLLMRPRNGHAVMMAIFDAERRRRLANHPLMTAN